MKVVLTIAVLFACLGSTIAQDCNNPLLQRADILARFGGSVNILTTPITAPGNFTMCPFLANTQVCVSTAGFTALGTYLDNYRREFRDRGNARDQQRFNSIGQALARVNPENPLTKVLIQLGNLFNLTMMAFSQSGASPPFDFSTFYATAKAQNLTVSLEANGNTPPANQTNGTATAGTTQQQQQQQAGSANGTANGTANATANATATGAKRLRNLQQTPSAGEAQVNNTPRDNSAYMALQKNYVDAKAKCAQSVMKQFYYAACLAASANYSNNSVVSGTSDSPSVKVAPAACTGYSSLCIDYFTYSNQLESTKVMTDNALSPISMQLYMLVANYTDATTFNSQMNGLAGAAQNNLTKAAQNASTAPWQPISCNSTNTTSSDCNYICTNVINATGFSETAFNGVSATASSASTRVLTSSTITFDASGINPNTAIATGDANIVVTAQSVPDTSSAVGLVSKIAYAAFAYVLALTF